MNGGRHQSHFPSELMKVTLEIFGRVWLEKIFSGLGSGRVACFSCSGSGSSRIILDLDFVVVNEVQ